MTRDPKLSLYRTSWRPRWGKGVTRKAKKLAGPVRTGRLADLPKDDRRRT